MQYVIVGLVALLLVSLRVGPGLSGDAWYWSSHFYTRWAVLTAFFALFSGVWFARRTSFFLFPLYLMISFSGIYMFGWGWNQYTGQPLDVFMILAKNGAYAYITLLMAAWTLVALPRSYAQAIRGALALSVPLACFWTIFDALPAELGSYPFLGGFVQNGGMNAVWIAAFLPFIYELFPEAFARGLFTFVALVTLYILNCRTAFGALAIGLAGYFLVGRPKAWKWVLVPCSLGLLFGATRPGHGPLFEMSGRFVYWEMGYHWWRANVNPLFGAGLGTTIFALPTLQGAHGQVRDGYSLFFHNDWFQVFFELGVVGSLSLLLAWGYLAVRSYASPVLFGSFLALSFSAVFYYPVHLPLHALAGICVVWLILGERRVRVRVGGRRIVWNRI